MTKSMLFFVAVLIMALGARPVLAGDERQLVAVTTAETLPDIGVIGMHDMCWAEFPGTYFCSSSDIIRNGARVGALPSQEPGAAWLHPSFRGFAAGDGSLFSEKVLARADRRIRLRGAFYSCFSWFTKNEDNFGLVIRYDGRIGETECVFRRPVACCGAPVNPPVGTFVLAATALLPMGER